jgi:UMF1 family MFS transporter
VFYNAYLPDIASEDERDRVSSFGWAMGYLGGGVLLALNLAFYIFHEQLGVSAALATRINLASAGVWWLLFSLVTWARLQPRHARRPLPQDKGYLIVGFQQLWQTFKTMRRFPETLKFLGAYFLYNDGIQTIIIISAGFATAPVLRGGLELEQETLTGVILMIQMVAFFGALIWGRLASRIGAKRAIMLSLIIWGGVVLYAYFGLQGANRGTEFAVLGAVIATVLGGSQAISRSLFSQLIPKGREAEFFSFYEVSDRGTSSIGPFLFAVMIQFLGSYRPAILALIVFFVAGLIALPFVNVRKGIEDVKRASPSGS